MNTSAANDFSNLTSNDNHTGLSIRYPAKIDAFATDLHVRSPRAIPAADPSRVVILLGPPGSGKGTQCNLVSSSLKIPVISSGDILRSNIRNGTELGRMASQTINSGALVSDHLIHRMLVSRLRAGDCKRGYILDGIPRTVKQAEFVDQTILRAKDARCIQPVVLSLEVDSETLLRRMRGRRICKQCSAIFNVETNRPLIDSVCDYDGAPLEIRNDDTEEVYLRRLTTYRTTISAIKDYYRLHSIVVEIDGTQPIPVVEEELLASIYRSAPRIMIPGAPVAWAAQDGH